MIEEYGGFSGNDLFKGEEFDNEDVRLFVIGASKHEWNLAFNKIDDAEDCIFWYVVRRVWENLSNRKSENFLEHIAWNTMYTWSEYPKWLQTLEKQIKIIRPTHILFLTSNKCYKIFSSVFKNSLKNRWINEDVKNFKFDVTYYAEYMLDEEQIPVVVADPESYNDHLIQSIYGWFYNCSYVVYHTIPELRNLLYIDAGKYQASSPYLPEFRNRNVESVCLCGVDLDEVNLIFKDEEYEEFYAQWSNAVKEKYPFFDNENVCLEYKLIVCCDTEKSLHMFIKLLNFWKTDECYNDIESLMVEMNWPKRKKSDFFIYITEQILIKFTKKYRIYEEVYGDKIVCGNKIYELK